MTDEQLSIRRGMREMQARVMNLLMAFEGPEKKAIWKAVDSLDCTEMTEVITGRSGGTKYDEDRRWGRW